MPGATYILTLLFALANSVDPVLLIQPPLIAQQPAADLAAADAQQPAGQLLPDTQQLALQAVPAATPQPEPSPDEQEEPAPDRWAAAVDFGFASSSGNSDLTSLTSGVRLKHLQTRLFKLEWSIAFRYGESQGTVVARNLQSKLDFDVGPQARVSPFVFVSAERDPFRKLDLRARTGSGVKYTFYRQEPGEASVRVAAQYSRENFTGAAAQEARTDGAWSMEFKGNRALGTNVEVENTTTFTPVFDDFADHNLDMASKVSSRITKHLALTLTHAYGYDSTPADGVGRTDQRFQAGLTIDF
jgi:putative salt-induced outer membrane protein YdiY